ncbi:hypothetical protein NUW54_g721 [Trametes sanguinea]|uniref:Uncharacterized protein n=1 Tax=Trametes sanguinea TaxID=158606 RepID=A0ACC1Q8D8_9APHY|nr:hypothetical protein NUW54_g721 [Trametes sanguinea]
MLPTIGKNERPQPRRGARTVRVLSVRRGLPGPPDARPVAPARSLRARRHAASVRRSRAPRRGVRPPAAKPRPLHALHAGPTTPCTACAASAGRRSRAPTRLFTVRGRERMADSDWRQERDVVRRGLGDVSTRSDSAACGLLELTASRPSALPSRYVPPPRDGGNAHWVHQLRVPNAHDDALPGLISFLRELHPAQVRRAQYMFDFQARPTNMRAAYSVLNLFTRESLSVPVRRGCRLGLAFISDHHPTARGQGKDSS